MRSALLPPHARHLLAACLVAAAAAVHAAPADTEDPMGELLAERALVQPATPAPPAPGFVGRMKDKAGDMIASAMNFLGVPYRRGGHSDEGFDCSGFTRHVFESTLGFALPRRVDEQAHAPGLVSVKRDELAPGDLVFFNTLRRTFSHVGIYIGDGKFIHSPRSGGRVRVEDMRQRYWTKRFTGARRAEPLQSDSAAGLTEAAGAIVPPSAVAPDAETLRQRY